MSTEVTLPKFNGKEVTLRYNFQALTLLEEKAGINVLDQGAIRNLSFLKTRDLVWAGLIHQFPKLTRDDTGRFMEIEDLPTWTMAAIGALDEAMSSKSEAT